jgi:hypothetical protein
MPTGAPVGSRDVTRLGVIVLALLVIAVGVALGLAQPWASHGSAKRLDAGGRELVALLAKSRRATWHARYTIVPAGNREGAPEELEVWRSGSRVRQEAIVTSGTTPIRTATFRIGASAVSCVKPGTGRWSCQTMPAGGLEPDRTFDAMVGDLGNAQVTARDGNVIGHNVRCFHVTGSRLDEDVCVSLDGVLLSLSGGGASVTATVADVIVPATIFDLPARAA